MVRRGPHTPVISERTFELMSGDAIQEAHSLVYGEVEVTLRRLCASREYSYLIPRTAELERDCLSIYWTLQKISLMLMGTYSTGRAYKYRTDISTLGPGNG